MWIESSVLGVSGKNAVARTTSYALNFPLYSFNLCGWGRPRVRHFCFDR